MAIKPGDIVKCVRGYPAAGVLSTGKLYKVAVVVVTGHDYKNQFIDGVIVIPADLRSEPIGYPYVWDMDRFEEVK